MASYAVVYSEQGEPLALLVEDERRVIVRGERDLVQRLDDYQTPMLDRIAAECPDQPFDGPLLWEGSAHESVEPLSRLYFGS